MLKILCIVDKEGTALDRLAQGVAKYHDNLEYKVLAVHPKRPDSKQLADFEREVADADIIDWQYFRTSELLRQMYPSLSEKKQILTHNNPYSIEEQNWNGYDHVVANNETIYERLGEITTTPLSYIPITVDSDYWQFNPDWKPKDPSINRDKGTVLMVANRIESKKGILPVAIACADLGLKFVLVGAVSNADYMQSILATGGNVEFHEQIPDEELRQLYYKSTLLVCNSVDNFESGTMPILEAMFCGVPVLTRKVGHVPDLYNGENMVIHEGTSEDVLGLKDLIYETIGDEKKLFSLRDKAWQTVKSRNFERRAYSYQKLYRDVLYPDQIPVSIVVPINDKPEIIRKCINALSEQTYKNIELVVADDHYRSYTELSDGEKIYHSNKELVQDFAKYVEFPVRYINSSQGDYGLARARNIGTIEATGDIIVYCDQRMIMDKFAVEEFVKYTVPNVWLFGNKGGKKEFVENFSCIRREDVINFGLFNERMDAYGGLSQETRNRFKAQGNKTQYIESAKAIPTGKSSNRNRKKQDIIKMKNRLFKMEL